MYLLTTSANIHSHYVTCLSSLEESLPSVPYVYEYPATLAMSDVHGAETRMHIPAHGGSGAQNEPPGSILSHESKPLEKHRPPSLQYVWSPDELSYPL
ncbi:hypothetical protein Tco_0758818 [Tanacetum coccineum]